MQAASRRGTTRGNDVATMARDKATMPLPARLAPALLALGAIAALGINVVACQRREPTRVAAVRPVPPPPAASPTPSPSATAAPALVVKRVLDVPRPFVHGKWVWNEEGAPATGPVVITVDRAAQTLSVFRDGYEIGAAVVLYGATDKPTPLGVFPITQKDADHHSNLYDAAPMPYMLRMTNDGVSIHGSDVKWGWATHGCVGIPVAFAKRLFGAVKLRDVVIVTDGKHLSEGQPIVSASDS